MARVRDKRTYLQHVQHIAKSDLVPNTGIRISTMRIATEELEGVEHHSVFLSRHVAQLFDNMDVLIAST